MTPHFVASTRELTADEIQRLEALLDYGDPAKADAEGTEFLTVPRLGTISPWASKATDIVHNCGIDAVERIERGVSYRVAGTMTDDEKAAVAKCLFDRMTETVLWTGCWIIHGGPVSAILWCSAHFCGKTRIPVRRFPSIPH